MAGPDNPNAGTLPARPLLPGFYQVIPMGKDALQLRSAGRVVRLAGPGVGDFGPRLMHALDGRRGLAAVVEQLELEPEPVADLVAQLRAQGVVSDAGDAGPGADAVVAGELYALLGARPDAVQAALSAASVTFIGVGPVATLAARHLASTGVGTIESIGVADDRPLSAVVAGCDLVIVEVDERRDRAKQAGRACEEARVAALFHSVTTLRAAVGPLVLPGTPGCLECVELRRLSHLRHYDEDVAYQQWLDTSGTSNEPSLFSGFASVVAGLLSVEALKKLGGFLPPVTVRGLLTADIATSVVRREQLLPVPGCPGCDVDMRVQAGR